MFSKIAAVAFALTLVTMLNPISVAEALPPGDGGVGSCSVCAYSAIQGPYCSAALFGGAKTCWLEPQVFPPVSLCKTSGSCTIKYPGLVSW